MLMPNADLAVVSEAKVHDYLLNPEHPEGKSKARFFLSLGFSPENWLFFVDELRRLVIGTAVAECVESNHGTKYIVEGVIESPLGVARRIRTVWIIDTGERIPRLVTAYPYE